MNIRFQTEDDHQLLIIFVTDAPKAEDVSSGTETGSLLHASRRIDKVLLDLREQTGSSLDGNGVRQLLWKMNRQTEEARKNGAPRLRFAVLSKPGSLGQGMASMFRGHSHGLEHIELKHFNEFGPARKFLGIPADWTLEHSEA